MVRWIHGNTGQPRGEELTQRLSLITPSSVQHYQRHLTGLQVLDENSNSVFSAVLPLARGFRCPAPWLLSLEVVEGDVAVHVQVGARESHAILGNVRVAVVARGGGTRVWRRRRIRM